MAQLKDTIIIGTLDLGHATDTTLARVSAGVVSIEGSNIIVSGGALGTPASGILTNCTGLPVAGLVALTASQMIGTTAGGVLTSLAVATYPSLTELTYVKGVTSAIQTQLGTKAPLASPTFTGNVTVPLLAYSTDDQDKIWFTTPGAAGSKMAHSTGWSLDWYAGPGNEAGPSGLFRFLTTAGNVYSERVRITAAGNMGIGTTVFGTAAAGVLGVKNGTAPTTSPADMVQLWAEDVAASSELRVRDEAGNVTTLSPHPVDFMGKLPIDTTHEIPWAYHSSNKHLGKEIYVDMALLVAEVERLGGKQIKTVVNIAKANWTTEKGLEKDSRDAQIRHEWEEKNMIEVSLADAVKEVAEEVDDTKTLLGTEVAGYRLVDGTVVKNDKPIYARKTIIKKKLQDGMVFNESTGKAYRKPTQLEVDQAVADGRLKLHVAKDVPKYLYDRGVR